MTLRRTAAKSRTAEIPPSPGWFRSVPGISSLVSSLVCILYCCLSLSCADQGRAPSAPQAISQRDDEGHNHAHGGEPATPGDCGHIEANGYEIADPDSVLVRAWLGRQTGSVSLREGALSPPIHWSFLDQDGIAFSVADTCPENSMDWVIADSTLLEVRRDPGVQWTFRLLGRRAGATTLTLRGWHEDHVHVGTFPILVTIAPAPGSGHALTGAVRLTGNLMLEDGTITGTRTLEDADGIKVFLVRDGTAIDSAFTIAGRYTFAGLPAGTYQVRTWVVPSQPIASPEVVLDARDETAGTLDLQPSSDFQTVPNPFAMSSGVGAQATAASAPQVLVARVLTLGGDEVWSFSQQILTAGFYHYHWPGQTNSGEHLPPGAYWYTLHIDGRDLYNLVFGENQ